MQNTYTMKKNSFILVLLLSMSVQDCLSYGPITEMFATKCREARKTGYYSLKAISQKSSNKNHTVIFRSSHGDETITLTPVENLALNSQVPVWLVKTSGNSPSFSKVDQNYLNIDQHYYVNKERIASFCIYDDFGKTYYDGFYGEGMNFTVIKSAPETPVKGLNSIDNDLHVAFKIQGESGRVPVLQKALRTKKWKLSKPIETFEPELLIVIDYALFENLDRSILKTVRYVGTYWNAVNLRYSKIEKPQINIKVTGIIISEDETALDYIASAKSEQFIDAEQALAGSSEYFHSVFPKYVNFKNYDAIITMSGLIGYNNLGIAYGTKICDSKFNVAFIRDDGCYTYNVIGTHELGHLMDIRHDEDSGCSSVMGDEVGSIMAAQYHPLRKHYEWTQCNKRDVAEFAWYADSVCLAHSNERNIQLD